MTLTPRVPKVIAGVLAMAASFTALGTIVWSDLAQATEAPAQVEEFVADDVAPASPVKMTKVEHKEPQPSEDDLFLSDLLGEKPRPSSGKPRKGRVNFGHFEGY
jgi:hypothetical protein